MVARLQKRPGNQGNQNEDQQGQANCEFDPSIGNQHSPLPFQFEGQLLPVGRPSFSKLVVKFIAFHRDIFVRTK